MANNENNNPFYILPREKWEEIKKEIRELKEILKSEVQSRIDSEYLACHQVEEMLHITQQTWKRWRKVGKIPFVQVGRTVLVQRADLYAFLNRHKLYSSAV